MGSIDRRGIGLVVVVALALAACSSDDSVDQTATTDDSSVATTVVEDGSLDVRELVTALASDDLAGRDNLTPGSTAAQELIATELAAFADPAYPDAEELAGYVQPYDLGANVIGLIPGADLADEYVVIGADYDHLGSDCATEPGDDIRNGATDNATGVAAAMSIGRSIAADGPPRRSVVLAFWDGEEDDFDGSLTYLDDPVAPLEDTIGYVNFDIQGANLLPSLAEKTIMVGAETGGPALIAAAAAATEASTLDTASFSLLFGQGRSDHAVFAEAGVPVVFFTDANTGCYHTVKDDLAAVDFDKLDQQIATAEALSRDLVATDTPPVFDADAPATTFQDASELLRVISQAEGDFGLFPAEEQASSEQFLLDLQAIVDAGEEAFDEEANSVLLGGAVDFVSAMAATPCDPDLGR